MDKTQKTIINPLKISKLVPNTDQLKMRNSMQDFAKRCNQQFVYRDKQEFAHGSK